MWGHTPCTAFFVAVPTVAELLEQLATLIASPKSVSADGHSITQHDLKALVEAAKLLQDLNSSTSAGELGSLGLRFRKDAPPGGGGDAYG